MKYRRLGSSGLEVSEIGVGCNNFGGRLDYRKSKRVVDAAIEQGVNLFDTANIYSQGRSEEFIGKALKGRRGEVLVATKCGATWTDAPNGRGASRKHIMDAVEGSLTRLASDHIDLYQIHRQDPATPIDETLRALDDLVRSGKVRYIGCSNYDAWRIADAVRHSSEHGLARFVSAQPEYSLVERSIEEEVLPACEHYGLGILPYFPLAHGFLTGKYRRGEAPQAGTRIALAERARSRRLTDANFDLLEALETFVGERGKTLLDLAFAWLLSRPAVGSVIAGASTPAQVSQNAAAAGWVPAPDDIAALDEFLDGGSFQVK